MLKRVEEKPPRAAFAGAPRRQRSVGGLELRAARHGPATRVARLAEAGASRLRLPRRAGGVLEAVIINTGGGIACGDRYDVEVEAGERADVIVTTASAEKVYRSDGPTAELEVRLSLRGGAQLSWLPQETILFDNARLRRHFEADLVADGALLMFEALVLGRAASGEAMTAGLVEDRWRIRRNGRLVYADALRLGGNGLAALIARPTVLGGNPALATLLYIGPDAETRLDEAREQLAGAQSICGASAWNGMLAVRFLAPAIAPLRRDAARFIEGFTGRALPRVWQC